MASHRALSGAERKPRASKHKYQGIQPQGVAKAKSQVRRSERLSRLRESIEDRKSALKTGEPKDRPPPSALKSRKRTREGEHPASRIPNERPSKCPRPSLHVPSRRQTFSREAASNLSKSGYRHINHWAHEGQVWPDELYEEDNIDEDMMHSLFARKKSPASLRRKRSEPSLITQCSATPSDQRPREEKSAPYKHARYELQLRERGIFMCKNNEGITDESKTLCKRLLETPQTFPYDSLFSDDLFEKTCEMIRNRNETRVIRDIAQLIVPSAEALAVRGAKRLHILTETVNEGWSNSIPLLGPRPQPDYGLGFKRESFNQDQLRKLQPFIGELDDQSLFAATYNMYFPFLTAEVKCGAAALDVADRQNAHSMALALKGLVGLFRLVGREKELHREINGFSVSHNDEAARIYGYYAVIDGNEAIIHRHPIRNFNFTELDGKEKWTPFTFTKNVYDIRLRPQFEMICSAIDGLDSEQDFELPQELQLQISETSEPSQQLEYQDLAEVADSRLSHKDLQQITPDMSTQSEKPAPKKKKKNKNEKV